MYVSASSPKSFWWYGILNIGIFNSNPACSNFFSALDHQTPCPPIKTGFLALIARSNISFKFSGLGQAFAKGFFC